MKMMKAAVLVKPQLFEIHEKKVPEIGTDDVLVRVARCEICGTDAHIFHGAFMVHRLPLVPGHEFAGTVEKVGKNIRHIKEGQRAVVDINDGCGHCYYCRRNQILNGTDRH